VSGLGKLCRRERRIFDQLERSQGLSAEQVASLRQAIQKAEGSKSDLKKLKGQASALDKAAASKNGVDGARIKALADVLRIPSV
jgi:glutamine synthetase adenylyltransferase